MKLLFVLSCLLVLNQPLLENFHRAETRQNAEERQIVPVVYWSQGIETASALKQAGIEQIAVAPDKTDEWRNAGFKVNPISPEALEKREKLLVPRLAGRANVASATRRPWIDSNGWRFIRNPSGKFYYDLSQAPRVATALAAAEAFTYSADAILKIDPVNLEDLGKMLAFIRNLPVKNYPVVADLGLIDDGSPVTGEVMNLLVRRNLLFKIVPSPSPQLAVTIKIGTREFPQSDAADPSALAQKVRQQLGDEKRTLRLYGSEVVIGRLTGDGAGIRLHLLNYSGSGIEGLRVRLRKSGHQGTAYVFGLGKVELRDSLAEDGAVESTISQMGAYAVLDFSIARR